MKRLLVSLCGVALLSLVACKKDSGSSGSSTPGSGQTAPTPTPSPTPAPNPTPNPPPTSNPAPVPEPTQPATGGGPGVADIPEATRLDYLNLELPADGDHALRVVAPTVLELTRIAVKQPDPAVMGSWNFTDSSLPAGNQFAVKVGGQPVAVQAVGFKRRPVYAPLARRDLRVESTLYLKIASAVRDDQSVEVTNPGGALWPAHFRFATTAPALRFGPAIHVNQEGYIPGRQKKALVGYYLGTLGEMEIPASSFQLVEASSGRVVHSGNLARRADAGWTYVPTPYQQVFEADFTGFRTPGRYRLVVPGLGGSIPFRIDDGIAMGAARAYALGLYHQRCGHGNGLPHTRHGHGACHLNSAAVPTGAGFAFTWSIIASESAKLNSANPVQAAPQLRDEASQLYPFVNRGPVDVSGGHHDAGDYSKYTINSASLVHQLVFAADAFPEVAGFDNLGLPESGDGLGDILQEAKIEADFLAKMQDADGGFYFLVYPRERRYEQNVTPDRGDQQVVWPKNTAATAAAVAALAEAGSSPRFKSAYPQVAASYLAKARAGWQFLQAAIARHGKAGAYQKITHYGDDFAHDDELAWAAAAMFVATGEASYHETLKSWYDPANAANRRWGWWHAYMGWGNALRAYGFAARSGRLSAGQLDAGYLAKVEAELRSAGESALRWSKQSAYGTSFPDATKRVMGAGWYFSSAQAFDLAVAHQLDARGEYLDAIVANLDYESGSNPVNVSFVTGLGRRRQHEIVHQYAQNDRRDLPPTGVPLGNLQAGPIYTGTYGTELAALTYPRDNASSAPFPFYDRWTDTHNVTTEFVHLDQARSLGSLAFLAAQSGYRAQGWRTVNAEIRGLPGQLSAGVPVTVTLEAPGLDLGAATIVWEASGQPSSYGSSYTFTPGGHGAQWIEAEAALPDGRRVFASRDFFSDDGQASVSVVATDDSAKLGDAADTATFTFTRTGSTAASLTVKYQLGGTAAKWSDYRRPEGDMPVEITIPAGATTVSFSIKAIANTTNANPQTVSVTVVAGANYHAGSPAVATATIKP